MSELVHGSAVAMLVRDDELLLRRIHPTHVKENGELSTLAFRDCQLSVHRAELTSGDEIRNRYPIIAGLAVFTAGDARELSEVERIDADPVSADLSHALVHCKDSKAGGLKRFSRQLRDLARRLDERG